MMDSVTVGHIALFVPDLREAESFYQHVFAMQLPMHDPLNDGRLFHAALCYS